MSAVLQEQTDRDHAERQAVEALPGETLIQHGAAPRHRDPAPVLHGGHAARRQLPRLHGRGQGRARARARRAAASPRPAWRSRRTARARCTRRRWCWSCWPADMPERTYKPDSELDLWCDALGRRRAALRAARALRRPTLASGDRGQPRRLHPVHPLRARLPRGAGQRRHRLRVPRRRTRPSCSTSTTRWAPAPAWPAANACGPARPAR